MYISNQRRRIQLHLFIVSVHTLLRLKASMDSTKTAELAYEFLPYLRAYTDGRVERLIDTDIVPPTTDSLTGVASKDVHVLPEFGVSARLFLPKLAAGAPQKLPLLVYFHGGAFCAASPFCAKYHNYLTALVSSANVVAVAVDYRKAPEHPIPAAYEDSWAALHWALSHCNGDGPEAWLNEHVDFGRVFLSGDSAGANIAHNLALVAGHPEYGLGLDIIGLALVHPFFCGSERLDLNGKTYVDRIWPFVCPDMEDNDDPRVNPVSEGAPSLTGLGCRRVLVCVAEKDVLKDRGRIYYEELGRSGWMGVVEFMESEGEGHGFHLDDLEGEKGRVLVNRLAAFLNRGMPAFI